MNIQHVVSGMTGIESWRRVGSHFRVVVAYANEATLTWFCTPAEYEAIKRVAANRFEESLRAFDTDSARVKADRGKHN